MKHFLTSLPILALVAVNAAAQTLPSAESILDRFVEVTGGKAAYQAQTSLVMKGTLNVPSSNLSGSVVVYRARPDQEYEVAVIDAVGKVEEGFTDNTAWRRNVVTGPQVKTGVEREEARIDALFNWPPDWRRLYPKAETAGKEMVEGEECYRVALTPVEGPVDTQYFSVKTGLRLKSVREYTGFGSTLHVEQIFSGYARFGGVLFPLHERDLVGNQPMEVLLSDIAVNADIPPEYFETPAEIKAAIEPPAPPQKRR